MCYFLGMTEEKIEHTIDLEKGASPSTLKYCEAFVAAQAEMPIVKKNRVGAHSVKYSDLKACVTTAKPILAKHGLAVSQRIINDKLYTQVMHKSGEWQSSCSELPKNLKLSTREYGTALTYHKRYQYCSHLGLVTEDDAEDDDGSFEVTSPKSIKPSRLH